MTRRIPTLLFGLMVAGCDAVDTPPVVVRDSAGIEVIEYPEGASVPEWSLSPEPSLAVGGLTGDPETELYNALHALRLPDRGLAVANQGTHELRFFDAAGRPVRSVGREGGGPGEYRQLWGLARLPGDSLVAWDWTAKRLTVYDHAGELARVVPVPGAPGFSPRLIGRLADHRVVITAGIDPAALFAAGTGVSEDSTRLLVVSARDGAVLDTLGPYPGRQQYTRVGDGSLWLRPLIFGREERLDVTPGAAVVGDDRAGEVRWHDPAGELIRVLRLGPPPSRVADQAVARYRDRAVAAAEEANRPELRRRLEETPVAGTFPAFDHLFADRLGRVWIRRFDPAMPPQRSWLVLDPQGHPAGRVRLPDRWQPVDAGDGYVLVHARDELDVESILLFGLDCPPASPDPRPPQQAPRSSAWAPPRPDRRRRRTPFSMGSG